ncbi:unnamed protein product, partial [Sphacelaria rigidula]
MDSGDLPMRSLEGDKNPQPKTLDGNHQTPQQPRRAPSNQVNIANAATTATTATTATRNALAVPTPGAVASTISPPGNETSPPPPSNSGSPPPPPLPHHTPPPAVAPGAAVGGRRTEFVEENRTSSAYILLQLRDVGRSGSGGDASNDGTSAVASEASPTRVGGGGGGGFLPPAVGVAVGVDNAPAAGMGMGMGMCTGGDNMTTGRKAAAADAVGVVEHQHTPVLGSRGGGGGQYNLVSINASAGVAPQYLAGAGSEISNSGVTVGVARAAPGESPGRRPRKRQGSYGSSPSTLLPGFHGNPGSSPVSSSSSPVSSPPPRHHHLHHQHHTHRQNGTNLGLVLPHQAHFQQQQQ